VKETRFCAEYEANDGLFERGEQMALQKPCRSPLDERGRECGDPPTAAHHFAARRRCALLAMGEEPAIKQKC
jgi:hypothetical protein